jgi:hypothetical protein
MTSQPIYFKESGDAFHYIKYQLTGDCMELGSYSNINDDNDPVFKFVNTFNSELLVSFNRNNIVFSKDTICKSHLTLSNFSKTFTCPKATFADSEQFTNGRVSICNTRIVNANGLVQIDCGRSAFSSSQSIDGMAIRKGTGGHFINFVKYDNSANCGQIRALGNETRYDQTSDRRLKTNIVDMRSMIDKIMELKPREYNWISDNESGYGFIAQEVHETFPHMKEDVSCYCGEDMENMDMDNPIDKEGKPIYFGVDYGCFTPYIVKAIQEQQAMISSQQKQIDRQAKQIEMLLKFNNLDIE